MTGADRSLQIPFRLLVISNTSARGFRCDYEEKEKTLWALFLLLEIGANSGPHGKFNEMILFIETFLNLQSIPFLRQ